MTSFSDVKLVGNQCWYISGYKKSGFGSSYTFDPKVNQSKLIHLSNGPDKKERTKRNEHFRMQKGAIFTIVSTTFLIGLNIKFYKIFAKQHVRRGSRILKWGVNFCNNVIEPKPGWGVWGIRKKRRRGLRKSGGGGGWKFTHFTSPGSAPACILIPCFLTNFLITKYM